MVLMFEKPTKWTQSIRKQEKETQFLFLISLPLHLAHPGWLDTADMCGLVMLSLWARIKKMMVPIMPLICSASYGSRMLSHKLFHLERSLMQMFYAFVTIKIANSE